MWFVGEKHSTYKARQNFYTKMKPILQTSNPDIDSKEMDQKLLEMWKALTDGEKIQYYIIDIVREEAWKVFDTEMKPILIRNGCSSSEIRGKLGNMWCSLNEEERKPYQEKATMLLTPDQVMKDIPKDYITPYNIFCEEKGLSKRSNIADKMWKKVTNEELKRYRDKANAKEREQYKQLEQFALKAINDAVSKITKEQEHLKKELNEKEEELKQRETNIIQDEELFNKRKAKLVKKEEHFHKVYILLVLSIVFIVFIKTN